MLTDAELLQHYVKVRDERAFAQLVQRHLGVVYGAALRRTGGRDHLAKEIAQKVFTDLALKSAALIHHPALAGWLHRSTRYAAIDAIRNEQRGLKLTRTLTAMPDNAPSPEDHVEWAKLRPVLDDAMEQLKESDREAMLLRFFEGLSFTEVGARLNLSENAARMRTERALGKLRTILGRRGVTSTTAALGLLLANQAAASVPVGLAANVTSAAIAAVPAAGGIISFLLMNKIALPILSAAFSAGVASVAWATLTDSVSDPELAALRAENARLTQAAATGADTAVADEFAAQATLIVQAVEKKLEGKNTAGPVRHSDHGQATPRDAFLSYGWAMDAGDVAALVRLTTYGEKGQASLREIYAGMPESIRAQYRTPEELIAFFFIADTLLTPVPGPDVAAKFIATEKEPGHALVHRPEQNGGMEFVQTADGWKCVVPDRYPGVLAARILGNEMLGKLGLQ